MEEKNILGKEFEKWFEEFTKKITNKENQIKEPKSLIDLINGLDEAIRQIRNSGTAILVSDKNTEKNNSFNDKLSDLNKKITEENLREIEWIKLKNLAKLAEVSRTLLDLRDENEEPLFDREWIKTNIMKIQ